MRLHEVRRDGAELRRGRREEGGNQVRDLEVRGDGESAEVLRARGLRPRAERLAGLFLGARDLAPLRPLEVRRRGALLTHACTVMAALVTYGRRWKFPRANPRAWNASASQSASSARADLIMELSRMRAECTFSKSPATSKSSSPNGRTAAAGARCARRGSAPSCACSRCARRGETPTPSWPAWSCPSRPRRRARRRRPTSAPLGRRRPSPSG